MLQHTLKLPSTDVCCPCLPWGYQWWQSAQAGGNATTLWAQYAVCFLLHSLRSQCHFQSTWRAPGPAQKQCLVSSGKGRDFDSFDWSLARLGLKGEGEGKLPLFTGKLMQVERAADKRQTRHDPGASISYHLPFSFAICLPGHSLSWFVTWSVSTHVLTWIFSRLNCWVATFIVNISE